MPVIFAALFGFIGTLISRIGQWFLAAFLTGALKTMLIYITLITALALSIYNFVIWCNDTLVGIVNGMSPVAQMIIVGIAALLPKNLPYLITIILTYYVISIALHLSLEVTKLKAQWADKAMNSFKA